jgi:hypothetical protein
VSDSWTQSFKEKENEMSEQTNETTKNQSKIDDLSPEKDVKGGAEPLRDKDGNLAQPGRLPVR